MRINKIFLMLLVIVMIVSSVGCSETIWTKEYEYELNQSIENVTSVKIVRFDDNTKSVMEVIKTLDDISAKELLEDISTTSCRRHFGDRPTSYCEIIIYIEFQNGEAELIGPVVCGEKDKNGNLYQKREYFLYEDFCGVVVKYVEKDLILVPEFEAYLQ